MLKLDNNLLTELGLGALPEEQKKAMLQHIYETLELRVGTNLANQMTDQQLEEFEKFIDDGGDANQAQALQWLEANLPNYKQVVNEVFEALKAEIRQMAPQIVASSSTSAAQPQDQISDPASATQYQAPSVAPVQQPVPPQPQQQFQAQPGAAPQPYYQPAPQTAVPADPASQPPMTQPQQPSAQPQSTSAPQAPSQPYTTQAPTVQPQPDPAAYFPQQQPPAGPGGYPQPPQQ